MPGFVKVARVSDVRPGEMLLVEASSVQVVLANVAGHICAFQESCTHDRGSLIEGDLQGKIVTCPVHGSTFDVTTGEVLEDPAVEDLVTYAVRIDGDEIAIAVHQADQRTITP